jgi:hypothetical protein
MRFPEPLFVFINLMMRMLLRSPVSLRPKQQPHAHHLHRQEERPSLYDTRSLLARW